MKRLALIMFVLLVRIAQADQLGDEVAALKIDLPPERRLSSNELRQVLQLAHDAGMKRVAKIGPIGSQSGDVGLSVTADEVIQGRRISRQELIIWHSGWRARPQDLSREPMAKGLGQFSLDDAPLYKREWTAFIISGKETRLECSSNTDLPRADKVFAALYADRIEYSTPEARTRASAMNFRSPRYISIRSGEVRVGFNHPDPWCGDSIKGKLREDKFVVEDAMTACS